MFQIELLKLSILWRYSIYILLSSVVTSGLNIIHTQYVLGIEPRPELFIVPIIAGIIFGYYLAKLKVGAEIITMPGEGWVYLKYIVMSCFVTAVLNIVHTEWVLDRHLDSTLFIAPLVAGVFFGYLLARIKILNNRLTQLATTDALTGANNRLHFDNTIKAEIDRVMRDGGIFSIIYFDIDNFKAINDEHGHMFGDKILIELVKIIQQQNRQYDNISRYGGEEFIILAAGAKKESAIIQANRLREIIMSHNFDNIDQLTCSFGIAEFKPDSDKNVDVIRRADDALYKAKNSGRNSVVMAD